MKISKLFHWLYGILMLLPCFAILVKCAYVAFNKNAYESYSGTNEQNIMEVTNLNNFEYNKLYNFVGSRLNSDVVLNSTYKIFANTLNYENTQYNDVYFHFYKTNTTEIGYWYLYNLNGIAIFQTLRVDALEFNFTYASNNFTDNEFDKVKELFFYVEEKNYQSMDNVFYYAVDEVCNNELFAWASNSFLNAPLTYITNLFNMPTDNAVILLMSYWFNISIIWLCFDVMIYVPLLVHRWLDKGIIE